MKKIVTWVLISLEVLMLVPACGGDDGATADLPPVYSCQGKALACESRTLDQCKIGGECEVGGSCSGTAASCSGLTGVDCLSQDGCNWDISTALVESCTGVPDLCSAKKYQFDCTGMKGCSWTQTCTGDKTPSCIALNQTQCKEIPGCSWMVLK